MNLTQQEILSQVANIRADSAIFMTDQATLYKKTGDVFVEGESRSVYASGVSFICRMITRSGSESHNIAAQARETQQVTFTGLYRIQVPFDLDVSEDDRIEHTGEDGKTKTFEVLYAPQPHKMMGARILQLQEVS